MRRCCVGDLGYLYFLGGLEEAGCWKGVLSCILFTGLVISSVTGMDDALRWTVLLVRSLERVREDVIQHQCVCRYIRVPLHIPDGIGTPQLLCAFPKNHSLWRQEESCNPATLMQFTLGLTLSKALCFYWKGMTILERILFFPCNSVVSLLGVFLYHSFLMSSFPFFTLVTRKHMLCQKWACRFTQLPDHY